MFLHAEVIGAAGHVRQRTDQLVAALKGRVQQPGTHLLHLLPSQHINIGQCHFVPGQIDPVQLLFSHFSALLPTGREHRLQHRVKGNQGGRWDTGPHPAPLPPSCSRTFLRRELAHLGGRQQHRCHSDGWMDRNNKVSAFCCYTSISPSMMSSPVVLP